MEIPGSRDRDLHSGKVNAEQSLIEFHALFAGYYERRHNMYSHISFIIFRIIFKICSMMGDSIRDPKLLTTAGRRPLIVLLSLGLGFSES